MKLGFYSSYHDQKGWINTDFKIKRSGLKKENPPNSLLGGCIVQAAAVPRDVEGFDIVHIDSLLNQHAQSKAPKDGLLADSVHHLLLHKIHLVSMYTCSSSWLFLLSSNATLSHPLSTNLSMNLCFVEGAQHMLEKMGNSKLGKNHRHLLSSGNQSHSNLD